MHIVTAGPKYLDIDAYGGIVAYGELLRAQGLQARSVSTAPLNGTVTKTIRNWSVALDRTYTPDTTDTYTLIDVSDPAYFEPFVDKDRVERVIDHHTGFEAYWDTRIGNKAHIEFLGAACTQVYEQWTEQNALHEMGRTSARLLATGILDNTLNFLAGVTSDRDRRAYEALSRIGELAHDWPKQYFLECQAANLRSLPASIQSDAKIKTLPGYVHELRIGQLALWNATTAINKVNEVKKGLVGRDNHWCMNLIDIGKKRSYILAEDNVIQSWLANALNISFHGLIAEADRLWLRKEIFKAIEEKYRQTGQPPAQRDLQ